MSLHHNICKLPAKEYNTQKSCLCDAFHESSGIVFLGVPFFTSYALLLDLVPDYARDIPTPLSIAGRVPASLADKRAASHVDQAGLEISLLSSENLSTWCRPWEWVRPWGWFGAAHFFRKNGCVKPPPRSIIDTHPQDISAFRSGI